MSIETKLDKVGVKEGILVGEGATTLVDCTDHDVRITALGRLPYISLHVDEDTNHDPDKLKTIYVNPKEFHSRPVVMKFDESNKIDCFTNLLNRIRNQFKNDLDKFEVFTDYKKIVKVTLENGKQGKALCNDTDTFDLAKGIQIAYNRAKGIEYVQEEVKPIVDHAEIGDIIVLSNGLKLKLCESEICGYEYATRHLETNECATQYRLKEDFRIGGKTFGMGLSQYEIIHIIKPNTIPLSSCTNEELINELQRRLDSKQ